MKENNGAIPESRVFKCNNREFVVDRFLNLLREPNESDLGMYEIDVTHTQLEDRLTDNEELIGIDILPVAVLFAGDFVCLDFREDRKNPTVVVWSHEESAELEPITYYVADNFGDFLRLLK